MQQAYDKNFNGASHSAERDDDNRPHKRVRLSVPAKVVNSENLQAGLLRSLHQLLELQGDAELNLSETVA